MSLRTRLLTNPTTASWIMTHAPESILEKTGRAGALKTVHDAVTRTRAYPAFLAEHGISEKEALDPDAFESLPFTSKKDYLDRYPLADLVLDGNLSGAYTIDKSSGTSGNAYYWPRTAEEEADGPAYLEFSLRHFFRIHEVPTLAVVALALGMWAAGEKVSNFLRIIAANADYPLTVVSPGINTEELLETITDLSPHFGQTVLLGYPPYIKSVIDQGIARGIDWKSLNVRCTLGGEGFSEPWRRHLGEKLGFDSSKDLLGISAVYAAADLGLNVGREYPLTVLIRQLCESDDALCRDLFGSTEVPNLVQYTPANCFAEEIDGDLVFTNNSGIPVVRYAIGDAGGVRGYNQVMGILADHGYEPMARLAELGYRPDEIWHLPFLHIFGRSDGTVFVGGLNVYPESISTILAMLDEPEILGFKLSTTPAENDRFTNRLLILLEHSDPELSERQAAEFAERHVPLLTEGLKRVNREYRRLFESAPELAEISVRVYAARRGPFSQDVGKIKRKYVA